ncbi:MAG: tetratricopeptide repeat protein, partial [Acidobacteriia bacterium]|nr:tetratricopeptide repeat protein [Terriglobia bacterium]
PLRSRLHFLRPYGNEDEIESRTRQQSQTCFDLYRVTVPDSRNFAWPPAGEAKTGSAWIAVLVNEQGSVEEAEALSGDEPFRQAALTLARQLHFPPITWPGRSLKTVRTVMFAFPSGEKVAAVWSFGKFSAQLAPGILVFAGDPRSSPGFQAGETEGLDAYDAHIKAATAFRRQRNLEQAIAEFRSAVKMNPEAVTAHQGLADALMDTGDQESAAKEYMEVTRLDPNDAEAHFRVGAYYEAHDTKGVVGFVYDSKTERLVAPKNWKPSPELKKAFEEYKKAHELALENAIYKAAYERLAQRLNQR